MKTIISLFAILMMLAVITWGLVGVKTTTNKPASQVLGTVTKAIAPTQQTSSFPKRLVIQKINVDAAIEQVGQDAKGNMDVPKKDENVGWYKLGYKPGDNGSAVIAGHFDTVSGSPAAFYNISKLQKGDTIQVIDENEKTITYTVTNAIAYDFDKVPLQKIFATSGKKMLNLITCDGQWDKESKNYSKRFVVYSEAK